MIEISQSLAITYIASYIIVFIAWLIFMNKYFKWKTKYKIMEADIQMLFVFSGLWAAIWEIKGMDKEFKKGEKKAKKTYKKHTKATTRKKSHKKTV